MPAATRKQASKKKPAAEETHESIAAQTEAFLKSGGEIQKVNSGVSGMKSAAYSYRNYNSNSNSNSSNNAKAEQEKQTKAASG